MRKAAELLISVFVFLWSSVTEGISESVFISFEVKAKRERERKKERCPDNFRFFLRLSVFFLSVFSSFFFFISFTCLLLFHHSISHWLMREKEIYILTRTHSHIYISLSLEIFALHQSAHSTSQNQWKEKKHLLRFFSFSFSSSSLHIIS